MDALTMQKLTTRDLCYIGISVAMIAVLAQISIPLPLGVPLTLQTFAVMLAGVVLGAKKATLAVIVYVLLGVVGVPVFTQFGGGFHRITGPWGGFLMSLPIMGFLSGVGAQTGKRYWLAVSLAASAAINLSAGMLWFAFVNEIGIREAFVAAFAPFIIVESIKIVMALSIGLPVRYAMTRYSTLS